MPSRSTTEFAPAKVNLTLHVTGQRPNGYHELDSLVVFCGIGDRLGLRVSDHTALSVTGPFAGDVPPGAHNLVLRAARAFAGDFDVEIHLEKSLPTASGLGGGSADAAAAIRALLRLREDRDLRSRVRDEAADDAAILNLGADVPVCLASRPARMRGIGERLNWLGPLPECHVVLVNPRVAVPTLAVFAALSHRNNAAMPDTLPQWQDATSMALWLRSQRNDMEPAALTVAPVIAEVLACLDSLPGALIARMSGSGATCFALFLTATAAEAAADLVRQDFPAWWVASGPVYPGATPVR